MRILYSHRIQSHDGQAVHVEEIVAALRQLGHDVLVVGPGFYRDAGFGGESRTVAVLRRLLPRSTAELAELAYNIPAYLRLRHACRAFRPDLIYERYNLFYLAGAWLARSRRLPFFVEVNAPLAAERARFGALRWQRLARWSERHVWRSADQVLAVTEVLKAMVAAAGVPAARISVTPNGIEPERFPAAPPPGGRHPLVLGFVGFVRAWHGLDTVLDSMARGESARFRLMVIGDGPARPALERQANALGLAGQVRFAGLASPERIPGLVADFDVALQPKVVDYASPLKIFEYMAAGRAIVAPDQPNIREILRHEATALLFDPQDPDGLWNAVCRLADEPGLCARLGLAAREEIGRRDYTWAGNARRIVDLFTTMTR